MPNPRSIKRKRPAPHVPKYDDELRAKIQRFIASFLIDAERMVERSKEMGGATGWPDSMKHQYRYWAVATSVARDLIRRARNRQRHLVELTDERIAEVIDSCRQRSMI